MRNVFVHTLTSIHPETLESAFNTRQTQNSVTPAAEPQLSDWE